MLRRHDHAEERLPRVHGRGRGLSRARAVLFAPRRAGHGGANGHGTHAAQPAPRARAVGVVGRPVTDRRRGSLERVLRRRSGAVRAALAAGGGPRLATTGHHHEPTGEVAETVDQPVKIDNPLYVRDYAKCILCYQCVDACGEQWQQTWAIGVAGRGFDARISTEYAVDLPDSACVYCGNCIQVCPTGALMFTSEHEMRAEDTWDEDRQTRTDTICPYCGVGCTLTLHVQDGQIVKVTSPSDSGVTHGNLCIKGRFGFQHVQNVPKDDNESVELNDPRRSVSARQRISARSAHTSRLSAGHGGGSISLPSGSRNRWGSSLSNSPRTPPTSPAGPRPLPS